eukprot:SAG11_NODE_7_length_31267_cov_19.541966_19_plen_40_part_00
MCRLKDLSPVVFGGRWQHYSPRRAQGEHMKVADSLPWDC